MLFRFRAKRLAEQLAEQNTHQSYWSIVRANFRKNRLAVWSLRILFFLLFVAVFADFIANDKPLICKIEGKWQMPIFKQYAIDVGLDGYTSDFRTRRWLDFEQYDFYIHPLISYSSSYQDRKNRKLVSPFAEQKVDSWRYRHWLGTDKLGRDVAAGLVAGTRIAMLVGLISMSVAAFLGILLGGLAGYFGDDRLSTNWIQVIFTILGVVFAIFYAFIARSYQISEAGDHLLAEILKSVGIFALVSSLFWSAGWLLSRLPFLQESIRLPMDILVMRLIEIFNSIPALLLILAVVAIIRKPSIFYIMFIIGLIAWTGIARFVRAELLRVRQLEFIEAARAMGFREGRTLIRHALPNALTPVLINIAFGIAGAILVEAALSFLGIGVSSETVSWGSMLQAARRNISAWWLAVFPGVAIFVTVAIFNLIGEGLTEALSAKN
ncbi:MAG: ABC transporter permease [Bacteroidota bacterium]